MSKAKPSYQELKTELDEILSSLQHDDIGVDQTVIKHRRGLEIIKQLEAQLTDAENTIAKLQPKPPSDS